MQNQLTDLADNVTRIITSFVDITTQVCSDNLVSIVLYGSAAEGRLRPTSDVNLIIVTKSFEVSQINQLRDELRIGYAAIHLNVMFILESEIPVASEAFAVKFTDILSRHRILHGIEPFTHIEISRAATLQRLKQVVVNLMLRLRERYALVSLREEQLIPIIADSAGPIRACAVSILTLQGEKPNSPKEALQALTSHLPQHDWTAILANMSLARERQELVPGDAVKTVLGLLDLLQTMYQCLLTIKN